MPPNRRSIHVHGSRNVIAETVHVHLFPPLTGEGGISRPRAWCAAFTGFVAGGALALYNTSPIVLTCVLVGSVVTLCLLLRGGKREPARPEQDQSPHG